jgi:alpha-galactosidase
MLVTLENPFLQMTIDPAEGNSWSLTGCKDELPLARRVHLGMSYRVKNRRFQTALPLSQAERCQQEVIVSPHGPLHLLQIRFGQDKNGLACSLDFALPADKPLLLWRLRVENKGQAPVFIDRLEMFKGGSLELTGGDRAHPSDLAFLSNGWQSWSYSGVYAGQERQRRTRLGFIQDPPNTNPETPRTHRAGHFSSDMFAVLGARKTRLAVVAGFLSQRQHFGSLEAWVQDSGFGLQMWANGDQARLDSGAETLTDWACLGLVKPDAPDPLGVYVEAVAREHNLEAQLGPSPTGWCSWYHFFQNIDPESIRSNVKALQSLQADLPLDLVQIDDGFEAQVGDWLAFQPAFPQGVAPLAAEIRSAGFSPGLWLAPFIIHPQSRLATEHSDWLLRGHLNRPVNAGFLWNTFTTALDLTNPGAQEYVRQVIQSAVQRWGFSYLKLDFLFAAALPGRRSDPTCTRAQVLRRALEDVRLAAGETTQLLGCGCPLGSAIGIVDAMRISSDVDVNWTPAFRGHKFFFQAEPHMPSARNALQNVLCRASLHRRWWINDPDCLLLRQETHLTLEEIQTLASVIALSGGSLLLSDDLPALPPDRLRIAESLLPLIGQTPHIPDWLDHHTPRLLRLDLENASGMWHLLALINWQDQAQETELDLSQFGLDPGLPYHVREFWRGQAGIIEAGRLHLGSLPAHGTALCALRPLTATAPQYLGSDLHVSQGLEVNTWDASSHDLRFSIRRPGRIQGKIWVSLPRPPQAAICNETPVQFELSGTICCIQLDTQETARIQLDWEA